MLDRAPLGRGDLALAVERVAERVDDATEHRLANGNLEQVVRSLDRVAFDDPLPLTEQHHADVVRLEIQRQPGYVVRELEHLQRHAVLQPVNAADAVGDREHGADLGQLGPTGVESFDAALQD